MKYIAVSAVLLLVACGGRDPEPLDLARDIPAAETLLAQAAEQDDDPAYRTELLTAALAADPWNGAAHNNLGVLALEAGDLDAALRHLTEARRLLPGHADPRFNLALTWLAAGRHQTALEACLATLEVQEDHLPAIQAAVLIQCREGLEDERTQAWLERVALAGESEEWRKWAAARMNGLAVAP